MLPADSWNRVACGLFLLIALLGIRASNAQSTGLPNSFVSKPATCLYYVNVSQGHDTGSGSGTGTAAFQTLKHAHDQLATYISANPSHGNLAVCIESGTYYAPDYTVGMSPNPVTTQTTAVQKATLDISVAGTATGQLWFMGAPGETSPVLIQSGYNGIQFGHTAQYITVYGVTVEGQDVVTGIPTATLAGRTTSSPSWPFYDGNCIGGAGDYPTGTGLSPSYISPYTPQHITILSNKVMNCGGGGIGFKLTDFITIENNMVYQNAYWSQYNTSGISLLDSVDVDGTRNGNEIKSYVINNLVFGNQDKRTDGTDGEGIIIDTNLNSSTPGGVTIKNNDHVVITPPAYQGETLVANNVIWGNGGAAVEAFHSAWADFWNNSTYQNLVDTKRSGDREIFLNFSTNLNVVNNIAVSSSALLPLGGNEYPGGGYIDSGANVLYVNTTSTQPSGWFPSWVGAFTAYVATDPNYANPAPGSPGSIDLTPGSTTTAAANGCTSAGTFCETMTQDVKFATRSATPYPSGAYYTTH